MFILNYPSSLSSRLLLTLLRRFHSCSFYQPNMANPFHTPRVARLPLSCSLAWMWPHLPVSGKVGRKCESLHHDTAKWIHKHIGGTLLPLFCSVLHRRCSEEPNQNESSRAQTQDFPPCSDAFHGCILVVVLIWAHCLPLLFQFLSLISVCSLSVKTPTYDILIM